MFIGKQSPSGLRCEFNSLEKQIKQMITAFYSNESPTDVIEVYVAVDMVETERVNFSVAIGHCFKKKIFTN